MENLAEPLAMENSGDSTPSNVTSSGYRVFDPEDSIHQFLGGGRAADILLWKHRHVSFGVLVAVTVAWLVFEWSDLSFLSISSDIMLTLIVMLFIRANYAASRNKQLQALPELELSEEMVNNSAATFRVKINYLLLMAHDITIGKDFLLFFKVVICLWLLSVIGGVFSFFTLSYIGAIISMTIPALYTKFKECIDRYCGLIHTKISINYRVVDASVTRILPPSFSKIKGT